MIRLAVIEPDHGQVPADHRVGRAAPPRRAGQHRGGGPLLLATSTTPCGHDTHDHLDAGVRLGHRRHTFDRNIADRPVRHRAGRFVFIQRINLGLYAILGQLRATANYRKVAEELWPMVDGPPSTPMGEAEAVWLAARADGKTAATRPQSGL